MSVLTCPPPSFSLDHVGDLLHRLYAMEAKDLSSLPSERDQNVLFSTDGGVQYILKISNAEEAMLAVDFQAAMLAHIKLVAPDLPVPAIVPLASGEDYGFVEGEAGRRHAVRLVTYLPGTPLAKANWSKELPGALGIMLGKLTRALAGFHHEGALEPLDWDVRHAARSRARLRHIDDAQRRALVEHCLDRFDKFAAARLPRLRHAIIHNDANDWNVLVEACNVARIAGLIDFGDAVRSILIGEVAVACAYIMLDKPNPVTVAADLVAGYHSVMPLEPVELDLLLDLIIARLCISVTMSASRRQEAEDNPYLLISERPAWDLLTRLADLDPVIVAGLFRQACGMEVADGAAGVHRWLAQNVKSVAPVLRPHPARQTKHLIDFANAGAPVAAASAAGDQAAATKAYADLVAAHDFTLGIGPWGERRIVYSAPFFASKLLEGVRRDVHLGLDLFAPAETPLYAPVAGDVVVATIRPDAQDYGGLIVLRHEPEPGIVFHTLWGHLSHGSVRSRRVGEHIAAGGEVARLGAEAENGGWLPHLHLQIVLGNHADISDVPGVGEEPLRPLWRDLFPDPAALAGLPPETFLRTGRSAEDLIAARRARLAPNLSLSYKKPLKMVRGEDVWLIDDTGRAYLDCYNNVAHVGHCHPHVVAAIQRQVGVLNTNTRYLHDNIVAYTERLAKTLPPELDTFFVVCTGSEANDVALRMARHFTGRRDTVVVDWAYHGHTQSLIDISPYKYKRAGGYGKPEHVHELPLPDIYRADPDTDFAGGARSIIRELAQSGRPPAVFIAETIPSVAGQIFLPDNYLREVYAQVRAAGGLCIADEVQVGFGRVGETMWAFQHYGVVPDIVTMGKPIGNGHPMAVVAVRKEIAQAFANGMEYFNTFGGNPVSCAAGLAVLEVLERDNLLANARHMGRYILDGLKAMAARHELIGDVRGRGLFFGVDLVTDRRTKAPATAQASAIVNRARDLGVLMGTDGPHENVIKMRPPMTFRKEHADILLQVVDQAIAENS